MAGFSAKSIIELIKSRGGNYIITPSGEQLFAISKNSEGEDALLQFKQGNKNFNRMSEADIQSFIENERDSNVQK